MGFGHCKFHGGSTRAGQKHAGREALRKGVLWYGDPDESADPAEQLLLEVQRTAGHVAFLAADIAERELEAKGDAGEAIAELRILETRRELYAEERQHLVKVCQVALAAGVEERRVQIAERVGGLIVEVLQGVLNDLNLSDGQQKRAPGIVRKHLSVIEGGQAKAA